MLNLTNEQIEQIVAVAQLHKRTIEANPRNWADVEIITDKEFVSIRVVTGAILSDNTREQRIKTFSYYLDENNKVCYSTIVHI